MSKRIFSEWFTTFRDCIANYGYYVDFQKVYQNVDMVRVELHLMNSLLGCEDIEKKFTELVTKYPEILKCIPLLLAVRKTEIQVRESITNLIYKFDKMNYPIEQYLVFMLETGLFDLMSKKHITNLLDYVTGVETGLDSNGRKNRGGHLMENLIESYIEKAGFIRNETYFKEMYLSKIEKNWNMNLSKLSNNGKTKKRFDFVIKTNDMVYGIETSFYTNGGSKLNETARSYKTLASESNSIKGFTFVWITDGKGWEKARENLNETFGIMPHLYNITDIENGFFTDLFDKLEGL